MTESRFYITPSIPKVVWFRDIDPVSIIGNLEYSYYKDNTFKKPVPVIGLSDT